MTQTIEIPELNAATVQQDFWLSQRMIDSVYLNPEAELFQLLGDVYAQSYSPTIVTQLATTVLPTYDRHIMAHAADALPAAPGLIRGLFRAYDARHRSEEITASWRSFREGLARVSAKQPERPSIQTLASLATHFITKPEMNEHWQRHVINGNTTGSPAFDNIFQRIGAAEVLDILPERIQAVTRSGRHNLITV